MKLINQVKESLALWLYCVAEWLNPHIEIDITEKFDLPKVKKGRVVKVTAPPEYSPETKRKGGRMVKRMPRQLQKIKAGQETKEVE